MTSDPRPTSQSSTIPSDSRDAESLTGVGEPFAGGSSRIFADPDPPADASPALYQIWEGSP